MIKFRDGEMLDLLPTCFKERADWIAFSYALKMAMGKLLVFANRTRMYAAIDEQPEEILDYMAVELRSQYYEESFDIETKREIIKKTLPWYLKAGTKTSVDEMMRTLFGNGGTIEWPDFSDGPGTPGTFDIETEGLLTQDTYERLTRIIERQKDLTSHLRFISVMRTIEKELLFHAGLDFFTEQTLTNDINEGDPDQANFLNQHLAIGELAYARGYDEMDVPHYDREADTSRYRGGTLTQDTAQIIGG